MTERSVTAFDLTFSAPKSVSVLYALGDPNVVSAVEDAHTWAVEQAITSVSSRISCTRVPGTPVQRLLMPTVCSGFGIGIARAGHWTRNSTITC